MQLFCFPGGVLTISVIKSSAFSKWDKMTNNFCCSGTYSSLRLSSRCTTSGENEISHDDRVLWLKAKEKAAMIQKTSWNTHKSRETKQQECLHGAPGVHLDMHLKVLLAKILTFTAYSMCTFHGWDQQQLLVESRLKQKYDNIWFPTYHHRSCV